MFKFYTLTSEEAATVRAIFPASASPFAPLTVTCISRLALAKTIQEPIIREGKKKKTTKRFFCLYSNALFNDIRTSY